MKKLLKAIAILSSFSVLTRALGFVFRIFLSRTIGAEGLGIYQIAFSVFMVLETIISSGLPLVISKKTASLRAKKSKTEEFSTISAGLIVGAITSIILCMVVLIFKNLFANIFTDSRCLVILFILMPSLVFSSVYSVLRGNLWGEKKFFLVSATEFFEQVIRITLTVLFLVVVDISLEKVFLASIAYSVSCVLSSVLVFLVYIKGGGKFANPKGKFVPLLKSSTPITLVRVISSLLTPIISILLPILLTKNGYTDEQALTLFGVAMGMTFPLLYVPSTLVGALSMTLIPNLSSAVSIQDYSQVKTQINFSIKFAYFLAFLFVAIFWAVGGGIGVFFYNNTASGTFLSYSAPLVLPICLSGITVSCLNALDLELKSFANYCLGAVLLVISIFALTKSLGVLSLVWGMGLCLGVASVLNIAMLGKKLKDSFFNAKYFVLCLVCALPCFLMIKWTFALLYKAVPLFVSLAVSISIGSVFYVVFALVFGIITLPAVKLTLKRKSKAK